MRLVLLDRDGVLNVDREDSVKTPGELVMLPGAAEAVDRTLQRLPELRDVGADFPSPERFDEIGWKHLDFALLWLHGSGERREEAARRPRSTAAGTCSRRRDSAT